MKCSFSCLFNKDISIKIAYTRAQITFYSTEGIFVRIDSIHSYGEQQYDASYSSSNARNARARKPIEIKHSMRTGCDLEDSGLGLQITSVAEMDGCALLRRT